MKRIFVIIFIMLLLTGCGAGTAVPPDSKGREASTVIETPAASIEPETIEPAKPSGQTGESEMIDREDIDLEKRIASFVSENYIPPEGLISIDFEDGQLNGFSPRGGDGRDTSKLTVTTEAARSGEYALLVTERSYGWNGPSLQVKDYIAPDTSYEISVWVHLKSPASAQMILSTQFNQSGSEQYRNIKIETVTKAGGWKELKGPFTYDSSMDLSDVTIYVESTDANAEFYIDDISLGELEKYTAKEGDIVWEASKGVSRHADTIQGYDYELWSQNGIGVATMFITGGLNNGGTYKAAWNKTHNVLFRSGKKFSGANGMDLKNKSQKGKTHNEIGEFSIDFEAEWNTGDGAAFVSVYGWAFYDEASIPVLTHNGKTGVKFSNQIEFYILQDRNGWNPGKADNATKKGETTIDGILFEIFESDRIGQPSIASSAANFKQYWSIPKNPADHRLSGAISVSKHFDEWEALGMPMDGPFYEVAMKVESYSGNNSGTGTASITRNILKINGEPIF